MIGELVQLFKENSIQKEKNCGDCIFRTWTKNDEPICVFVMDYRTADAKACILWESQQDKGQTTPKRWPGNKLLEASKYLWQRAAFREKYGGS